MFQTMTQIGKEYNIDAKTVGKLLYKLKIRDANHSKQKGFPYEQAITHGIAKAFEGRSGETYYRYNIGPIKEEFEKLLATLPEQPISEASLDTAPNRLSISIEGKLQQMLSVLNSVLESGEVEKLYRLKADIADIYALLQKSSLKSDKQSVKKSVQ
ncbi:hypothetical protein [Sulfurimonas sp. HSL3-7]|uniref:hypothetical protein n=1 Tax=Sulfonitrofixus jiaomeiensis TaxID=3131938 RepID=UPI0031F9270F